MKSDTMPNKRESIRIQRKTNDKDVKISMEDGNVTALEIDGKVIEKSEYNKYQDIIDEIKPNGMSGKNGRMFFFGDDGAQSFSFNFGDGDFMSDSLMKLFDFDNFSI